MIFHRKVSVQDENLRNREHNLFVKKVPKDAEACNIQVATCKALSRTFVAFVRLTKPVLLEDFCEIEKPTRFLVIILGPEGLNKQLLALGPDVQIDARWRRGGREAGRRRGPRRRAP